MNAPQPNLWQNAQFRAYLGSTAFSGTAMAMQQLLISWLLVGILLLPANQVGVIQAVIGLPGIVLLLLGGASADKTDPRRLLIQVYALAWLFPLVLIGFIEADMLNIWTVGLFGIAMSIVTSFTSPAQQAILNRVAGKDVQRAVTVATAIGMVVQVGGLLLAGQMEIVGVTNVLIIQAVSLVLGAFAVRMITAVEIPANANREPTLKIIAEGFRATYENKTILQTLIINFTSSIFNAGAFMTALPFIVKRAYDGDAFGLATVMIVFYTGATISNIIQFKIMPLARPGFWFLTMQLTRAVIVFLVWLQPGWWFLLAIMFVWGLNMGVTTNLSRAIVQESARPEYLARILSVYSLGLLGTMPIGALILGFVIDAFGTMNALVPAMVVSSILCAYGFVFTDVAKYRSPGFQTS